MTHSAVHEERFFTDIGEILRAGRETAYRSVNTVMVNTYWQIGRRIVEREQHGQERANYGEHLIVNLSRYLTDCFEKGFSEASIRNIRQFYLRFSDFNQFATQCVGNLAWTHIRLIMRDETIVKYSVLQESKQIFASKYKTILPTESELAALIDREGKGLL